MYNAVIQYHRPALHTCMLARMKKMNILYSHQLFVCLTFVLMETIVFYGIEIIFLIGGMAFLRESIHTMQGQTHDICAGERRRETEKEVGGGGGRRERDSMRSET